MITIKGLKKIPNFYVVEDDFKDAARIASEQIRDHAGLDINFRENRINEIISRMGFNEKFILGEYLEISVVSDVNALIFARKHGMENEFKKKFGNSFGTS